MMRFCAIPYPSTTRLLPRASRQVKPCALMTGSGCFSGNLSSLQMSVSPGDELALFFWRDPGWPVQELANLPLADC